MLRLLMSDRKRDITLQNVAEIRYSEGRNRNPLTCFRARGETRELNGLSTVNDHKDRF